ncbi:MAG: Lrp/AsnC family transcriptional regulator [Burkholderiaceae bacterium]
MNMADCPDCPDLALLNPWQHGFPLEREPFARLAEATGQSVPEVLARLQALHERGVLSRIGGAFAHGVGGSALLVAMAVPPARLDEVARQVSALPGVNHNYEREHRYNLWFVITGADRPSLDRALDGLGRRTGLPLLRLPMRRAYRIDLGFDLRARVASVAGALAPLRPNAVAPADRPLAALAEAGLPLVERPFDAWAERLGWPVETVFARLRQWLDQGTLRRFGIVVRHHELGFDANAMTVFDLPESLVDRYGEALAREPGITLAYRRERDGDWPFNLYAMVHGRDREAVREVIARAVARTGLTDWPCAVLFSRRRFKQTGATCFGAHAPQTQEVPHAVAG